MLDVGGHQNGKDKNGVVSFGDSSIFTKYFSFFIIHLKYVPKHYIEKIKIKK